MAVHSVLVVEDESAIADTIVYALKSEGFAAHWSRTGGEALLVLLEQAPALIIMDIGLPDISGFELCKAVRRSSQVPIIFLTARDNEIDKVVGLEIGADDYVVKPFSPRELTARVRARLRNHGLVEPIGAGLQLDEARQQARLNGRVLSLTRYEFHLLAVLAAAPGRVFSREQLLDLVWDDAAGAFDRTVDTHIKTLRQKLRDAEPRTQYIITHRGVGYAFAAS